MAINSDKNSYTVIFAAVMVVVVGSILAFLASGLSTKIKENERFEKQQNILYAMGVNENDESRTEKSIIFYRFTEKACGMLSGAL
jgi:Na+-transporting NADH:ubiquinone oxidoreductase subunit C